MQQNGDTMQQIKKQALFSNVFPIKLKKLQNLPRTPIYQMNIITTLSKKTESMSLKILLLFLSIISLKISQKCDVKQSPSMHPWIESLHRQEQHEFRQKRRRSSPISYYSNTSATQRILLEGDIEKNTGSTSTTNNEQ